jgi:hypothetical protein
LKEVDWQAQRFRANDQRTDVNGLQRTEKIPRETPLVKEAAK